jgi:methionyl-tRNA formyltransferase
MPLRVVFMGTPDFALPTLVEIVERGHEVVAVYTRAPKAGGRRGLDLVPSAVERAARRRGLSVRTPATLRTAEAEDAMRAHGAQVAVVVAYGLILPKPILDAFPRGAFNLHASLLPRWRGAAPINRAIMAGDPETGVMVMRMEEGLDTGPIAMAERVPIDPDATAGDLHDRLAPLGADLMVRALGALERGSLPLTPQPEAGATYAPKIDKNETRVVWERPWREVHNHIRGLSPFPGAWCEIAGERERARIKLLRTTKGEGRGVPGAVLDDELTVACGDGAVRILELQRAGRQVMKADEFLRGTRVAAGTRLG